MERGIVPLTSCAASIVQNPTFKSEIIVKALIICSVHAVCDISALERQAINKACDLCGIPAILTPEDHARSLAATSMLEALNALPGTAEQRGTLVANYLEILNDDIWSASLPARQSTLATLLEPNGFARPTGFVSDYPLMTTNLVRSAALLTNATKLGHLTTLSDPVNVQDSKAGLSASAASLQVRHEDVDVLVAHQRDFDAALALGMHPRFIRERQPFSKWRALHQESTTEIPAGATLAQHASQPLQVVA